MSRSGLRAPKAGEPRIARRFPGRSGAQVPATGPAPPGTPGRSSSPTRCRRRSWQPPRCARRWGLPATGIIDQNTASAGGRRRVLPVKGECRRPWKRRGAGATDGEGVSPISANLTSRYTYPASVLVYFHHLAWSLPVAFCKIFCNEIPAFETFTQRQNRIYCAPEQIKCKRCLPPPIRLGGIFFTDVRAKIPLALEYAGFFLILVCAEGIPRGKKNVLARQLQR